MRVLTHNKCIVELVDFQYSASNYRMLTDLQQIAPNLPLRVKSEEYGKFIPISTLNLENPYEIIKINGHESMVSKG